MIQYIYDYHNYQWTSIMIVFCLLLHRNRMTWVHASARVHCSIRWHQSEISCFCFCFCCDSNCFPFRITVTRSSQITFAELMNALLFQSKCSGYFISHSSSQSLCSLSFSPHPSPLLVHLFARESNSILIRIRNESCGCLFACHWCQQCVTQIKKHKNSFVRRETHTQRDRHRERSWNKEITRHTIPI